MITYFQAIILGLLQGISELFPISSLGHSVILPKLVGWNINQNDSFFLTFLVATHLATSLVLLGFFWKDWVKVVKGLGRSLRDRVIDPKDAYAKLGWLLVVGTIPAGILGLLLQDQLRVVFASALSAAIFLIVNGLMLYGAEYLRKRAPQTTAEGSDERIAKLGWKHAIGIGSAQALALIPGFSRSGSSMAGSLLAGLSNEDAARFSFLLATPIILGAAALKVPELFLSENQALRGPALAGAIGAAVTAYFAVRFLTKYFEKHTLTSFARYCVVAGALATLVLLVKR